MTILSLQQVYKRFGAVTAVDGIDCAVRRGHCVGLLGPNGAGKTTTVKMAYGLLFPDAGELRVFDLPIERHRRLIKRRLGVVAQRDIFEETVSALENLRQHGRYYGLQHEVVEQRALDLLHYFELGDRAHDDVFTYSGGMKRRLSIARALLNQPDLLLLDEPTIGLDPQARHLLWERIAEIKARGTAILLTTHYMEEAERLCDYIYIIDRGRIIAEGTTETLIDHHLRPLVAASEELSLEAVFLHLTGRAVRP